MTLRATRAGRPGRPAHALPGLPGRDGVHAVLVLGADFLGQAVELGGEGGDQALLQEGIARGERHGDVVGRGGPVCQRPPHR